MQYALVDSIRSIPEPGLTGDCEMCGSPLIAKCGEKILWHWAHKSKKQCDPWWENETPWHREWKEQFDPNWREIVHTCPDTGEHHRADLKTANGIVVEIQNSPISLEELRSREAFYKNMIWIINGQHFKERFHILHQLPNPKSDFAQDLVFFPSKHKDMGRAFWRKSENPEALKNDGSFVIIHSVQKIQAQIEESYCGHNLYDWVRPHIAWLEAKSPVYVDLGSDILWQFQIYDDRELKCLRGISKRKLIHDIKTEMNATEIGTKFYPIR